MFSSRRIIGIYLVFATLWIWIGDQLVAVLVPSLEYVTIWQMAKGVLFVAISGLLLTILMKRQFRIIQQASEQMQRYMRRLELLRQLDKALLSAESPQEVTHTAVERIREMTPCYHVSMTLFDADSNMAFVSAASTVATSYFQEEQRFSFVRGIEVLRSGQVFQVDDIQQLVELTPTEKLLQKEGIRSYIHIPVQVRGRLTGTINLVDRVPQRFSAEDIAIASEVTTRVSLALQQAQLLEHARDENIRLESLRQAGLRLSESLSLEDVFHQILDSALKLCDHIDVVYIYMYQNDTLTIGHSFVRSGSHTHEAYQPRQNGVHYAVAHTGSTIVVEDLAQDTRFNNTAQSYSGTIVALPLKIGTQVIGVLSVYNYQPCSFSVHDISLFRLLSDQASLTLHNALLHEQMRLDISQLESLRQVSLYLTSHLELQPVLDVILEYTLSLTEAKNAHIFLYDGDKLTFGAAMWE
ncbi:MAG: GAF domain-containing protein, partial [Anaerolineaceae bacterium]|nr:GAF domain-containing protein [Anaerolineaceae bacterium]